MNLRLYAVLKQLGFIINLYSNWEWTHDGATVGKKNPVICCVTLCALLSVFWRPHPAAQLAPRHRWMWRTLGVSTVAHTCFLVVRVSHCVSPSARLGYVKTNMGKMHLIQLVCTLDEDKTPNGQSAF